jgi:hypothetical protein
MSDLSSFFAFGVPITGVRYIKRKFGPVPAPIMPVLHELEAEGILTVAESKHYGKQKTEYIVHVPINGSFLTPGELTIVNEVIAHVCDEHTAKSVSEASHDHIWKVATDGEEIPLYTVFAQPGKITPIEREWAKNQLASSTV